MSKIKQYWLLSSVSYFNFSQKKKDPNQGEPSDAQVYLETRERKTGRDYKTTKIVDKRIVNILLIHIFHCTCVYK